MSAINIGDVSRSANISLSVNGNKSMELSGTPKDHSKLKKLSYEESGHTGFQKELTAEQKEALEKITEKEDKSNKIQSVNDMTGSEEEYFSAVGTLRLVDEAESRAKAHADGQFIELSGRVATNEVSIASAFKNIQAHEQTIEEHSLAIGEIFGRIDVCGDFELVKSDELTEKVATIELTLPNQYKELYVRFYIPKSEEAAADTPSEQKARFVVQTLNDENTKVNKIIYTQGNQFIPDYKVAWCAVFSVKVIGSSDKAYCRSDLWYREANMFDNAYALGQTSSTYSGFVAPSVPIKRDYIRDLKFLLTINGNTPDKTVRYLPVGTTYEIWGVRK